MLHADRFKGHTGASYASSDGASLGQQRLGLQDDPELSDLLSRNLSPNKRAVVEALLNTWESNQGVHLEHTG